MKEPKDKLLGESKNLCTDLSWYSIDTNCSDSELLAISKVYARDVTEAYDFSVNISDLDWKVSARAKRRAGVLKYKNKTPKMIILSRKYFENKGWDAVAATIRHELIHAHLVATRGDATHGDAFKSLAEKLQTHVHCDTFVDPDWIVECLACECEFPRYRRSKVVRNPDKYACGKCGGDLQSMRNE